MFINCTYIIINIATVVLIYVGAIRVDTGHISQGEVVALVNYMSQILVELIKLANLIVTLTKATACINRIADVLTVSSSMEFVEAKETEQKKKGETEVAVEFKEIDWDALYRKEVEPPFIPNVKNASSTENIDDVYTSEVPIVTPTPSNLVPVDNDKFHNFSYAEDM